MAFVALRIEGAFDCEAAALEDVPFGKLRTSV
jgi:hypothetical protein